jgi:hypothetical protein
MTTSQRKGAKDAKVAKENKVVWEEVVAISDIAGNSLVSEAIAVHARKPFLEDAKWTRTRYLMR